MGLASNVAAMAGCPIPLGQAAEALYAQMIEEQPELARKDFSSVYKFLRKTAEERKAVKLGVVSP